MKKLRVGIIFGGRSGEYEVSLNSAKSVLNAIDRQKYDVVEIGITHQGEWLIGENVNVAMLAGDTSHLQSAALMPDPSHPGLYCSETNGQEFHPKAELDVLFPVLHGTFGEDGTLQGLMEMAEIAYVGCGVLASAVGMDKGVFKDVMAANHIPVVDTLTVLRSQVKADAESVIDQCEALTPYPMFIKPANLGSSVGITKCSSHADLLEGLLEACRFDRRIIIQPGIDSREIEVSVLGNDKPVASVPGEVIPSREFYSYESKYVDGTSGLLIPAPLSDELTTRVQETAVQAFQAIDGAGLARVDFLLERGSESFYLNEVNTMPGFTEISMYPKLWEASGLPYPSLIDRLIELALERKTDQAQTERSYQ